MILASVVRLRHFGTRVSENCENIEFNRFVLWLKTHVGREETCADHCTTHALGDTSDSNLQSICQHNHETECQQCESLEKVLKEIESEINRVEMPEEHRLRLNHDYKLCLASIHDWKAQFALVHVDSASCLISQLHV